MSVVVLGGMVLDVQASAARNLDHDNKGSSSSSSSTTNIRDLTAGCVGPNCRHNRMTTT
jgi:hypothetical protein